MSDQEFQWIKPDGTWSMHRSLNETMEAAVEKVDRHLKVYSLFRNGKKIRRGQRRWVLRGLRHNLETGSVGDVYSISGEGEQLFKCRETKPAVKIINTSGNARADKCWSYGKAEYSDCSYLGAYVCKHIVGSYSMSQHSYGNAIDFGRDSMDELYDLAYFLLEHQDTLALQHVIVDDRIWTRGSGWSHYGGQRHYHVHADFTPQYSGGCGVRG